MADRRGGFTLIEVLVAMVIGGIIIGSLFQLMSAQGRFVDLQSAREEVQQNTRAALELIGSELRGLPAGDALVRAASDSITFRTPRVWGVVCAVPSALAIDIAVPAIGDVSYTVNTGTGVAVNVGNAAVPLWTNAVPVTAIGAAANTCGGSALPAGVERRSLTMTATPQNGATTPAAGHTIYLYDVVTYRTGTSGAVPGRWVQRRVGDGGSNQPLAGPIQEIPIGLGFAYYTNASTAPVATPISNAATRAAITRVRVSMEAISRNLVANTRESKADTAVITLRNRM